MILVPLRSLLSLQVSWYGKLAENKPREEKKRAAGYKCRTERNNRFALLVLSVLYIACGRNILTMEDFKDKVLALAPESNVTYQLTVKEQGRSILTWDSQAGTKQNNNLFWRELNRIH